MLNKEVLQILKDYNLGGAMRWLLDHSQSQGHPYHSLAHCVDVMHRVCTIWGWSAEGRVTLPKKPPKQLVYAALFHDANHSGGFFTDDAKNVDLASSAFSAYWFSDYCLKVFKRVEHDMLFEYDVSQLIMYTKYPFAELDHIGSMSLQNVEFCIDVLRDADFMNRTEETLLNHLVGIKQELFKYDSWKEYLDKTLAFYKTIKYRTEYGLKYGKPQLQRATDDVTQLYQLLYSSPTKAHE